MQVLLDDAVADSWTVSSLGSVSDGATARLMVGGGMLRWD